MALTMKAASFKPLALEARQRFLKCTALVNAALAAALCARAADQPQWGQAWSRNMVSAERHLPDSFDPKTGRNIKWSA